ncbi:potassium-transporting ATPase subunit KdpC [Rugamonas apoptosis]|uniref:Potassium-transporting ATPase KdpC subunit n=1 Tax=Rugamonas apoptosis TaxID=2758570 RepID=A0A7W2FAI0_9BURK|nr:potassium-transporting ATPase subunit KdpC [Rugamonas apoptosis]MBA5688168.1 potassium-transporting ATPase subunit KdpC [Rugamonas apoptosis]
MSSKFFSTIRPAVVLFGALTIICGVLYPLAVTGVGAAAFPAQAGGSIIEAGGKPVGSELIGQAFSSPRYFWGRPSATSPMPNNGAGSSGSNLGPNNPAQTDAVKGRVAALRAADPNNELPIPVDLVTASGSGLDPEISLAAAQYQARRVAAVRQLSPERVFALIAAHRQNQYFGFFGEARVNVLALNLALDAASGQKRGQKR